MERSDAYDTTGGARFRGVSRGATKFPRASGLAEPTIISTNVA